MTRFRYIPKKVYALSAFLFLAILGPVPVDLNAQIIRIDLLKAKYIEDIIDYVSWVDQPTKRNIKIGILGNPNVFRQLTRNANAREKRIPIEIIPLDVDEQIQDIDVLFVPTGHRKDWSRIRDICIQNNVLAIGEEDGFVRSGGAIEFFIRKNRLRFTVEEEHARKCGIHISSKLIELSVPIPQR